MSNFIMVPVPEDRVPEVYVLLGNPAKQPETPDEGVALSDTWTTEEIFLAYQESPDTLKQTLRYLAENADKGVHSDKLYGPLGYTSHQFAGMMGAWGRRAKNRYRKSEWFFDFEWDDEAGMAMYTMPSPLARIILEQP